MAPWGSTPAPSSATCCSYFSQDGHAEAPGTAATTRLILAQAEAVWIFAARFLAPRTATPPSAGLSEVASTTIPVSAAGL
jgi:hypothetical protein